MTREERLICVGELETKIQGRIIAPRHDHLEIVNGDNMKDLNRSDRADFLISACAGALFFVRSNVKGSGIRYFLTKVDALNDAETRSCSVRTYGAFEMILSGRIVIIPAFSERLHDDSQLELEMAS